MVGVLDTPHLSESVTEPGGHQWTKLAGQGLQGSSCLHHPPHLGTRSLVTGHHTQLLMRTGDLNLGPHTLSTNPCPSKIRTFFSSYFETSSP